MKKSGRFVVALMMVSLGVMLLASTALAVTYSSGFQVKNMSATDPANINIRYFLPDGTEAITAVADSIPAGGSKTYFPIHPAAGFNGSVVIESDQQISAIANTLGDFPQYAASSNGFSAGATTINLPLVMKNNAGFSTWFNVQNAGTAAATVNVTYSPGGVAEPPAVILPGAAKTYNQGTNANLTNPFVGSAVVTSDQPVVATVMQIGSTSIKTMLAYNSFAGGSTEIKLPLVMANNAGFFTGIQAMNTGTLPTDITITYGANTAGGPTPTPETCVGVAAGDSCSKVQFGGTWTFKYIGSANVTNTAAQPMVAIVNQLSPAGGKGSAYEGFDTAGATTSVVAPLVMANNSGFFTGIQVQNVGTANCDITVDYSANTAPGTTFNPTDETFTGLTPGASNTFLQFGGQWTGKYVGSAAVTGTGAGCLISAIVNELNFGSGDQLYTYNATAQ